MKLSKRVLNNIEAAVVVFLLLSADNLNIPNFVNTIINLVSYPVVILLVVSTGVNKVAYVLTKDKVLILLVGLAFVSIFWSEVPSGTLAQLRGLIRVTIFGAYLATRYTVKEQMRLLAWTIAFAAILSLFVCIVAPSYGIAITNQVLTWRGIYKQKQYLARIMVLGASVFIVFLFSKQNKRWLNISFIILLLALILATTSKTALILCLLSLLLLPLYKVAKQQPISRVFIIFIILLFAACVSTIVIGNFEFIVVDFLGKDIELNGRMPIWEMAIDQLLKRPLLGYGYGGFWLSDAGAYIIKNSWASLGDISRVNFHAHNGFIDLTLQLGIVGLLIFIFDIFLVINRVLNLISFNQTIENFWTLEFIAIMLVVNISELITFLSTSIFWIFYVSVALSSSVEISRIRRNKQYRILT